MLVLVDGKGNIVGSSAATSMLEARAWIATEFGLWLTENWEVKDPFSIPLRETEYQVIFWR